MRGLFLVTALVGLLVGPVRPLEETFVSATEPLTSNQAVSNSCVTFQVGAGTGCDWMCNYCANQLGTANYYFTTDVCHYETGGCVGNPQPNTPYTCCSA